MKFILQENKDKFEFKSDKKNFDIRFNRVAFIFFIFFLISIIYCIHLTHLGSRDLNPIFQRIMNLLIKFIEQIS